MSSVSQSKEILFECGANSGNNFNGWSIRPFGLFDAVDIHDHQIEFYSDHGGEFSICLIRKIDEMIGFSTIYVDMNFEALENCQVNYVTVYLSTNGKSWDAISKRADLGTVQITNGRMNYLYVKVVANVTFFSEGRLIFKHAKIQGSYNVRMSELEDELEPIVEKFFVFSFNKVINIETQNEEEYEVIITNISGQIVYMEKYLGSFRIDFNYPDGIYIVSIVQDGEVISTKKISI